MMTLPKISVVTISYGHELYIDATIDGVLMQNYAGEIEFIIANDNSPDKTDEVVKNYLLNKKIPNNIKILYTKHDTNRGMMLNFEWALNQVTGKYTALCEGDDYWTDPLKLQKQVSFMESNPDFTMCFHSVGITMSNSNDFYAYDIPKSDVLLLKDIIRKHYIPTCSLVFRNGYFKNGFPKWFSTSISGDIPLEILLSLKGKTKFIPEKMACYRRNEGGISQSQQQLEKMRAGYIDMYSNLANEIEFKSAFYLRYLVIKLRLGYVKAYLKKVIK